MGIDRTVDSPVTVDFKGRKYKVGQVTTQDFGEIARHLKTLYIGEVGKSMRIAGVSESKVIAEIRKVQFEEWGVKGESPAEARKDFVRRVQPLISSMEGMAYILYVALRREQSQLTLQEAEDIIANNPEGMEDLIAYVMGGVAEKKPAKKNPKNATKAKAQTGSASSG